MSIGINGDETRGRSARRKFFEVKRLMDPFQGLFAHWLWFSLFEGCELAGFLKVSQNGLGSFRSFRMPFMHLVRIVGRVGKEGEHD